jgi:hypothetical protein
MLLILSVIASSCWAGKVYKCTDSNGNVYFTDSRCPNTDGYEKEELQNRPTSSQTNLPSSSDNYYSVENQLKRMKEDQERKNIHEAYTRQLADRNHIQSKNKEEAEKLRKEAQELYEEAASKRTMLKSQRRALQEQAQSLERQADVLLGRREILSPTRTERLEKRVRELQDNVNNNPAPSNVHSYPQYVPSIGKWCQQQGGVMNCW